MALITNSNDLLLDLNYDNLSAAEQAKVNALIDVYSQLIEKYCNRVFLAADYVEEISGDDEYSIFIKYPPINSLAGVTYVGDPDVAYESSSFNYKSETGEIQWNRNIQLDNEWVGFFPCGFQNIVVSYNGGFSEVPMPIQLVCAELVINSFDPSLGDGNIEAEKLGNYSYKLGKRVFSAKLSNNQQVLSLYKLR